MHRYLSTAGIYSCTAVCTGRQLYYLNLGTIECYGCYSCICIEIYM
eukprot:SAG31_NODE_26349_length_443_cov_15.122093_1_plen_45_part_01